MHFNVLLSETSPGERLILLWRLIYNFSFVCCRHSRTCISFSLCLWEIHLSASPCQTDSICGRLCNWGSLSLPRSSHHFCHWSSLNRILLSYAHILLCARSDSSGRSKSLPYSKSRSVFFSFFYALGIAKAVFNLDSVLPYEAAIFCLRINYLWSWLK